MSSSHKASESLLAEALKCSRNGIAIFKGGTKILYVNDAMKDLFGYPEEELGTAEDWIKLVIPDKAKAKEVIAYWKNDLKLDDSPERRFLITHKDGSELWCRVQITKLHEDIVVLSANDITAQVSAEKALRESERLARSMIDSSPMGMMMYEYRDDGELVFSGYNPAADELLGVDNSQFMGKTIEEAFPPLANTEIPSQYRRVASEGGTWHTQQIDYEDERVSGAFEVFAFQTGPNKMVTSFFEVTERKQAEHDLKRLAAAVNSAAESIIITDAKGIISYVNPCFEEMTGFSSDEVVGQYAGVLSSGRHNKEFYEDLWLTILSGEVWHGRFLNKKKDGSVFEEEAVISPIKDKEGNNISYVAVKRDVSRENMLQNQVRQSQKMAAIGQIAHTITHAFSNTLTMILGNARLAKDELTPSSNLHEYIDQILIAVRKISTLTGELLAFAHPAPLILRPIRTDKVLTGIEKLVSGSIASNVKFSAEFEDNIGKINVDIAQLEQAIMHIIINADDAMEKGGEISLKVEKAKLSAAELTRLQGSMPEKDRHMGDFALISISDTGCGMTGETCSRIFDPFFSTKDNPKNSGLGLSTVFNIISQHSGQILVESEAGKGTTFLIYLPIIE